MEYNGLPEKQGLYDPQFEHDACGIGFIANIKGKTSHGIINQAIQILKNLAHRGGVGSEPDTGDGAGILIQMPHAFMKKVCKNEGIKLPKKGDYGVGMLFLSPDKDTREESLERLTKIIDGEKQKLLGIREVEITEEVEETFITMADMEKLNNTVEDAKKALEEKEKYTEESLKKLQEVYKQYQDVLNGENVTQEQVDEANAAIEKAFKDLKVKETADDKKDDNKKPAAGGGSTGSGSTGGGSTGSGTTGSGSAGKGSSSITSPKTGDTMNVAAWALAFAASAAAAGTVVVKRKKED